ncbi:hypothetical protein [Vibrio crassostreae]|uniref:hypothetical protein n=1 Tax=Vibrio crassostreae TaxID=246167 RepID=UPI001B311CB0|nr:hypothetical protein [Vibrio crassostreae]
MEKILNTAISISIFLLNIVMFMFFKRTLKETLLLSSIILATFGLVSIAVGVPLYVGFITLESEVPSLVNWIYDGVLSFLDLEKLSYIGVTYMISLSIYLAAELIIKYQNKRQLIPLNALSRELKMNSRAVLIIMTNALSLIFKLLVGMSIILIAIVLCSHGESNNSLSSNHAQYVEAALLFLLLDIALFVISKFLVSAFDDDIAQKISSSESEKKT